MKVILRNCSWQCVSWSRVLALVLFLFLILALKTFIALPPPPQRVMVKEILYGMGQTGQPKHHQILLWSQMRSGSMFTQKLLTALSCTFLSEEPLRDAGITDTHSSIKLLRDILHCRFSQQSNYTQKWIHGHHTNERKFKTLCQDYGLLCKDPAWMDDMCKGSCVNFVRVVKPEMGIVTSLLEDAALRTQLVHLVRDPRALLASRSYLEEGQEIIKLINGTFFTRDEKEPAKVCERYRQDLTAARLLLHHYPHRYTMVRYEDLTLNPERVIRQLYTFLGLPYTALVDYMVTTMTIGINTEYENLHPFSTRKNTTNKMWAWRERLTYPQMLHIQTLCSDVLEAYGYPIFTSQQDFEGWNSPP
ncbi:carbohydrate sulfotransferase 1-like [Homarus americanus]|uniref:Carbohydrate sulfotransferase 1-like 5 n=1 Tax=Homarus americanus TaxID=6706 RepID=A0A8J5K2G2_HOMAM|nr:carbohydrate sulfotransferase 1-like [Homarus americanus]KAG7168735.1 Carbohydrate sulfotransferase 1-like 5 [Homarus americanus]